MLTARRPHRTWLILFLGLLVAAPAGAELLYAPEGNRLRVLDLGSGEVPPPLPQRILIERASAGGRHDRDINGTVCHWPDGSGRFTAGEDSGQPERPAGWGIFEADGIQVGKLVPRTFSEAPEPFACAFDGEGRLFTTEIGDPGFGAGNGQLILWFPPFAGFPESERTADGDAAYSTRYCVLATGLGTPGELLVDAAGRVLVATSSGTEILRFSPPYPTGPDAAGGCGSRTAADAPQADAVQREVWASAHWLDGLVTYSGLAAAPGGHVYVSSVFTGRIAELDADGQLVRLLLAPDSWLPIPPFATGTPQALALGSDGSLYYADLDLVWEGLMPGPGPDGKLWRIPFAADGEPGAPELLLDGLRFPDGVAITPGSLSELPTR